MNKQQLEQFLLKARANTYAGAQGKMQPALSGSAQYEYTEENLRYQDVYFIGNGIFSGLETVYDGDKPVWSMSYFGDFSKMTEEQTDTMLRKALIDNKQLARIYKKAEKDYGDFRYVCDGEGTIDKLSGTEEIFVGDQQVFVFYYAGGYIG